MAGTLLSIALVANTLLEGLFAGVFFAPDVIRIPDPFFNELAQLEQGSIARNGFALTGMGCLAIASVSAFTLLQPEKKRSTAVVRALAVFHSGVGFACFTYKHHMGNQPVVVHGLLATLFAICVIMMDSAEALADEKEGKDKTK